MLKWACPELLAQLAPAYLCVLRVYGYPDRTTPCPGECTNRLPFQAAGLTEAPLLSPSIDG